ncbi:SDR family oxidoreductase, partial [Micromonospora sp. ATA32]|nr:SDR family oxidoreductase [Micromonospora sp. ATA32]
MRVDLLDPGAPGELVAETVRRHGRLDAVVAAHAYSTHTPLGGLDATEIDRHLLVNVRATLLLAEAFAAAFTTDAGGRLVLFSSGQRLGPMPGALAYAVSKAAVENLTFQLAPLLMPKGITVNCLHPGPTDTGYASPETHAAVARQFPLRPLGHPSGCCEAGPVSLLAGGRLDNRSGDRLGGWLQPVPVTVVTAGPTRRPAGATVAQVGPLRSAVAAAPRSAVGPVLGRTLPARRPTG